MSIQNNEIENKELIMAMEAVKKSNSSDSRDNLIDAAFKATVLVPVSMQEVNGDTIPVPITITTEDGRLFQPVFTDNDHIDSRIIETEVTIIPMEFGKVSAILVRRNDLALGEKADVKPVSGIVINPTFETVVVPAEVLQNTISKIMTANMTDDQYLLYERCRFEQALLPSAFFKEGEKFLAGLINARAKFVFDMCQLAFARKELFPYKEDDFIVTPIRPGDNSVIVKIDMPEVNLKVGTCEFVMMAAERGKETGRFFAVVKDMDADKNEKRTIVEITPDNKGTRISDAPEEGTEINWLIDYIK